MKIPISAIVLTYNEEDDIKECLESVRDLADEIFVVDSGSSDKTLNIARQYTDKIFSHPFENYAVQRNWAENSLPIKNEWVLHLDADERISPELAAELDNIFSFNIISDGFIAPRSTFFRGRWIKRGGHYPIYHLRIFRMSKGKCEDRMYDQHFVVSGKVEALKGDIINKIDGNMDSWKARHRRWARLEAQEVLKNRKKNTEKFGSPIEKRRYLKYGVYYKLPLFIRPILYFLYRYIIIGGFLDGYEGLLFHFYQGLWFRMLVDIEIYRLRGKKK